MAIRNLACEKLLTARLEQKMKSTARIQNLMNRVNVARPKQRDDRERPAYIPADAHESFSGPLSKEIEAEEGGAGVYQPDYHEAYLLEDEAWKNDIVPELLNGRNVYDFIDPEIGQKLQQLEAEEDQLQKQGFYDSESDGEMETSDLEDIRAKADWIRKRHKIMMSESRLKKSAARHAVIPRKYAKRTASELEEHFDDIGMDAKPLTAKARAQLKAPTEGRGADAVLQAAGGNVTESGRLPTFDADVAELMGTTKTGRSRGQKENKLQQRKWSTDGRKGEGDRRIQTSMPKHLFSGKRGIGKSDRR